ncbi:hypothetical protein BWQ96_02208 [Gracilariopsis chorda]|uniref:Uncharacterized protein n=1 Tax=Gracilariopsis chorda TaxID=448386 RepID=A0A2V3J206_9FLOR|nr:hypothetical protein BWQ96_02208 [Gracilariopsis chorda]|eukprot:PXF48017.1 hypothetical protein BWQ96_02208 [Gracilariopsis chorda]
MDVKGLLDEVMHSMVPKRPVVRPLEHAQRGSRKLDSAGAMLKVVDTAQSIQNEKSVVEDFRGLLYNITNDGNAYGLTYCRSSAHKRNKHYLSLRMRCLKYIEPCKCKAALMETLKADKKASKVMLKLDHNHESGVLTEIDAAKRVWSVCSSILFWLPRDKKPELTDVLSLSAQSDSVDVSSDLFMQHRFPVR